MAAVASFVATSVALGVSTRAGDVKVAAPAPDVSLKAALTAIATADSYFVKIATIPGESIDTRHRDEIDVSTVSWGLSNSAGTATGATFGDVGVSKLLDRASPLLFKAAAAGTNLGSTLITAEKNGSEARTFLTLTLSNTRVKSYHAGADTANGASESVGFGFSQIKMTYSYQTTTGQTTPISGCWNLTTHTGC